MQFRILGFVICLALAPALPVAAATVISPTDPDLVYTGRWEAGDPSAPWSYWIGSSLIVYFEGTSLQVEMEAGGAGKPDFLRVIIDGDAAGSVKIPVAGGAAAYVLAAGLVDGPHRVEIVKETDIGRWIVRSLELDDDCGLLAAPPRPPRRIVYYGDSNLAGYSLESEQNEGGDELRGSYRGYAGVASRMLDAEYQNISRSGATISSLHGVYDRMDYGTTTPLYDFARFPADLVVLNIGANDVGRPVHRIKEDYHALLDDVRDAHPDAHIVVYNAWGWDYDEPANFTHEVVAERGDPDMSCATFPWIFEQWHGCEYDHAGMAQVLADHLSATLGWESGAPDVMSGFALYDDFANGGFEQVAPFGGYGWRYYTDAGISREYAPTGAQEGEYFLRLTDGAAVHQPISARDGEDFTTVFWLRAGSAGDEAQVTLDFRDQEMWTEPLASFTETFVLTADWNPYTLAATAPIGSVNPVFHARLTLAAAAGSVVEIDDVCRTTGCPVNESAAHASAALHAGPNPFNPLVNLEFTLPAPGCAALAVYDVSGRRVASIAEGEFERGTFVRQWNGRDEGGRAAASGSYFARLVTESGAVTRQLVLIR